MKQRLTTDSQSPSDLLTDLKDLVAEAEKLLESSVGDRADDAVESLRNRYDAAQERLSEAYGKAKNASPTARNEPTKPFGGTHTKRSRLPSASACWPASC